MNKFCSSCGKELPKDGDVCLSCGKLVKKQADKKEAGEIKNSKAIIALILGGVAFYLCISGFINMEFLVREGLQLAQDSGYFMASAIGFAFGVVLVQLLLAIPGLVLSIISRKEKPTTLNLIGIGLTASVIALSVVEAILVVRGIVAGA